MKHILLISSLFLFLASTAFSQTVFTARKDLIWNQSPVVTNVNFGVLPTIITNVNTVVIWTNPPTAGTYALASDLNTKPSFSQMTNAIIYKPFTTLFSDSTSTVVVIPSVQIYNITVTNPTVIVVDYSNLDTTNQEAVFQIRVLNTSTNYSITWPSTNSVKYVQTPPTINANSQTIFTVWRKYGGKIECNPYWVY